MIHPSIFAQDFRHQLNKPFLRSNHQYRFIFLFCIYLSALLQKNIYAIYMVVYLSGAVATFDGDVKSGVELSGVQGLLLRLERLKDLLQFVILTFSGRLLQGVHFLRGDRTQATGGRSDRTKAFRLIDLLIYWRCLSPYLVLLAFIRLVLWLSLLVFFFLLIAH